MPFKNIKNLSLAALKKARGVTSFEFYFVMAIIGLMIVIGLQRYLRLAEETQRFSFEILSHQFNTAVNELHTRWIMEKQKVNFSNTILVNGTYIRFSKDGWPVSASQNVFTTDEISLIGCKQLWMTLFQNPEPISYSGGDPYGSRVYHLTLSSNHQCRYQLVTAKPNEYFFDYSPITGQTLLQTPIRLKK